MLNQSVTAQPTSASVPELGHLKAVAERLGAANYNLATFYTRFFGPQPEQGANASQCDPVGCYRNDLTAVFDQIAQLETLVNNLQAIG